MLAGEHAHDLAAAVGASPVSHDDHRVTGLGQLLREQRRQRGSLVEAGNDDEDAGLAHWPVTASSSAVQSRSSAIRSSRGIRSTAPRSAA